MDQLKDDDAREIELVPLLDEGAVPQRADVQQVLYLEGAVLHGEAEQLAERLQDGLDADDAGDLEDSRDDSQDWCDVAGVGKRRGQLAEEEVELLQYGAPGWGGGLQRDAVHVGGQVLHQQHDVLCRQNLLAVQTLKT